MSTFDPRQIFQLKYTFLYSLLSTNKRNFKELHEYIQITKPYYVHQLYKLLLRRNVDSFEENISLEFCSSKYTHDYHITKLEKEGIAFLLYVKTALCQKHGLSIHRTPTRQVQGKISVLQRQQLHFKFSVATSG